jgi:hypothetical protein
MLNAYTVNTGSIYSENHSAKSDLIKMQRKSAKLAGFLIHAMLSGCFCLQVKYV